MNLKVKRLVDQAIVPKYATAGAGCFDLHAVVVDGPVVVESDKPVVFATGLSFEVPPGWVMLVFSRSGSAFKHSTRLANCVGVIDSDYRGEVKVKLTRDSAWQDNLVVENGDRIAQAMLVPAEQWEIVEVDELTDTERGTGGFGSTGA